MSLSWYSLLYLVGKFLQWLNPSTSSTVDTLVNGALLSKFYIETYDILEKTTNNNYQWPSIKQGTIRRIVEVHNIDALTTLST